MSAGTVTPGTTGSVTPGELLLLLGGDRPARRLFVSMTDSDCYHQQLQRDAQFLCSDLRMDTELVDRLVLQLNRIYPQILSDKEARRFRNLSIPTKVRLAQLLKHLYGEGEDTCHEFYRGLHIHAEDVYSSLPSRVRQREIADPTWTNNVAVHPEQFVVNDRGPMFFLSCFSFVAGIAMLYYYGGGETLRRTGPFLHCSAARLASKGAKDVLITYAEVGRQTK
ncbi:caspase recruitment domain-containing protein 19-like isoform X2 [Paralichthys olivaceus]|uniref:caspase recruitment domain-containing protein 19-like isoform X2 n=1 Tax=Paralichthys olivaceus TaxID=8255 RepID=UPI00097DD968|nr:PREDICTED: caspase recruitment domain-containing protein 19-like [Paralichthys olivaceus]